MWHLSPLLHTVVTFAYFKPFGIANLAMRYWNYYIQSMRKNLYFPYFLTGISSASETFLIVFSSETNSKAKLGNPIPSMFLLIESRLGWFLSLLINCCRNCILRASNTRFHGDILVAQTTNYITEVVIKYFSYLKTLSYGFSIFQ